MEADHVLQYGPRVPANAGRQTIPFPVSRPNGVTEPSAYGQVQLAHTRIHAAMMPGDVELIYAFHGESRRSQDRRRTSGPAPTI